MRALIAILLLALILGLVGWVQYSSTDGDPTFRVNTEKVKQDTSAIVERSKRAIDATSERIDQSIERNSQNE